MSRARRFTQTVALGLSLCCCGGRPTVIPTRALDADNVGGDGAPAVCHWTQAFSFIEAGADSEQPCGTAEGTCVSGTVTFTVPIAAGDVGEVYIFGEIESAPFMIFRRTTPPATMGFKVPQIPSAATTACSAFQIGGRLDVGGNNQGMPGGNEDSVLPTFERVPVTLHAGSQVNGVTFTVHITPP
jgi:hypothetical protein